MQRSGCGDVVAVGYRGVSDPRFEVDVERCRAAGSRDRESHQRRAAVALGDRHVIDRFCYNDSAVAEICALSVLVGLALSVGGPRQGYREGFVGLDTDVAVDGD